MLKLTLFLSALAVTAAMPVERTSNITETDNVLLSYAIDISTYTTPQAFKCFKDQGYTLAFIRGWIPNGPGGLDPNACQNIANAQSAGLMTEIYMSPSEQSDGRSQFNQMYNSLCSCGFSMSVVWIQVSGPISYTQNTNYNHQFLNTIVQAAFDHRMSVGTYTNHYDWTQILGSTRITNPIGLWYFNTNGCGPAGETQPNFSDFVPFGGYTSPSAKQFATCEGYCGFTVNRDIFVPSGMSLQRGHIGGYIAMPAR